MPASNCKHGDFSTDETPASLRLLLPVQALAIAFQLLILLRNRLIA